MDDLIAFVTARLDEDEAVANAAASAALASYWLPSEPAADPGYAAFRLHIASHDPFRVLREVEARRRIVDRCGQAIKDQGIWGEDGQADLAVDILRQLAAVWSDHPDYRPEWKP